MAANQETIATAFVARGRTIWCNRGEVTILIPDNGQKSRFELIGEKGQIPAGTEVELPAGEVKRLLRSGHLVTDDPGIQVPAALKEMYLPA